ncbi:GNAT family N-acetyltransferase [Kribbella qitaiheensis]|uniref:GNAT family N-acetyltransferase n=1 Tax=Kribbella qitaiheensis TaxID=1544730 RepID=A0A7G6WSG9_9ACTN|nr:GNAT family N-acetyltransferase [Kribbella qitaiheensis]QNE16934.1 GNAT family N-acetyltransferase [Kribbella qitaiheensis]
MVIGPYDGDREPLRPLFRLADDSDSQIDKYLNLGEVLVAEEDGELVGQLQLIASGEQAFELNSMAIVESRRGTGIGRALVAAAIRYCEQRAAVRLLVATAAADTGNLRFYQRQGFRMLRIERDAFTPDTGYAETIIIDGVPLRDRVWLDQPLPARPKSESEPHQL